MEHGIINEVAICIVVAWLLAVAAQILRQPLILAYLVAGFAVGPIGIGLVKDLAAIESISALGLILLLFMIGLEIDLKKILGAGRTITVTALVQILGSSVIVLALAWGFGFPLGSGKLDALYVAVAAALSSTVIIVKVLYEKRELDTISGRLTLGVLVIQDLFAILFLAMQPSLRDPALGLLAWSLAKVSFLVALAFGVSRYALPPLFRAVARLPELVLVGSLAWCFLVAGVAGNLGLSRELGALVAGVAISTFPYTLDVAAKVTSLRDFFVTLFFVSLGMTVPAPTWSMVGWAALVAFAVIVTRLVTVFPPLYMMRQGFRATVLTTVYLSQISELSLVILALGARAGEVGAETKGIVAYAFVLLAAMSSYAMIRTDGVLQWIVPKLNRLGLRDLDQQTGFIARHKHAPKMFMLGFSWTASSLVELILRTEPQWIDDLAVLDFNPQVNQELRSRGVHVIYGDITQRDTLLHAGVGRAEIIICTLPNTVLKGATNLRLLQQLREINSRAQIIVHSELLVDVPKLYAAGASFVSVPRLLEAADLHDVIEAARANLLDEKRAIQERELAGRVEVIP